MITLSKITGTFANIEDTCHFVDSEFEKLNSIMSNLVWVLPIVIKILATTKYFCCNLQDHLL